MGALLNHLTEEQLCLNEDKFIIVILVGLGEDAIGKTEQEADPASLQCVE